MSHDQVVLHTLRLGLTLCLVLIPAYGIGHRMVVPHLSDPLWLRSSAIGFAIASLVATYWSAWVRRHALGVLIGYLGAVIVWQIAFVQINQLAPEAAVGFLFTLIAVGTLLGLASSRLAPLAGFVCGSSLLAFVAAYSIPSPESAPAVFVLNVLAVGTILTLSVHARLREREEREERERTLEEAERLANVGSWSYDLRTHMRYWSEGMYRLVGLEPRADAPPAFFDFIAPDEREPLHEAEQRLINGEVNIVTHTYDIHLRNGMQRRMRSIVRLIRSPSDNRPARLVGVAQDITAQVEHERGLEQARQAAEEAAILKTSILANMSHEIRTPLTAVIGYAQLLRDEVDGELETLVAPIEKGGERLLATLNSVLDLSRLESGAVELAQSPVNVTEEAAGIVELLAGQAEARGLALNLDAPEAPVVALGEQESLNRVLTNLVSNAIKFTPEGSVTIRLSTSGGEVCVEVSDTGRGISADFLPRLFEPFHQESSGNARSYEGSGLGLAITERLVAAMGGTITVESELSVGSTFRVCLAADEATSGGVASGEAAPGENVEVGGDSAGGEDVAWISLAPAASDQRARTSRRVVTPEAETARTT